MGPLSFPLDSAKPMPAGYSIPACLPVSRSNVHRRCTVHEESKWFIHSSSHSANTQRIELMLGPQLSIRGIGFLSRLAITTQLGDGT